MTTLKAQNMYRRYKTLNNELANLCEERMLVNMQYAKFVASGNCEAAAGLKSRRASIASKIHQAKEKLSDLGNKMFAEVKNNA